MYDAVGRRGFRWVVAPAGAVAGRPAVGVACRAAHVRQRAGRGVRERVVWGRVSASGRCGGKRGSSGKRAASVSGRHDALYLIDCKNGKKVASFFRDATFSRRAGHGWRRSLRGAAVLSGFTPAPFPKRRPRSAAVAPAGPPPGAGGTKTGKTANREVILSFRRKWSAPCRTPRPQTARA